MPIKDIEIKTFETKYMCDEKDCAGELKPTGIMLMVDPPKFPHLCSICKTEKIFTCKYPTVTYKYI